MKRNHSKHQAMVMGYLGKLIRNFTVKNKLIPNSDALQMLGVTIDDVLKSLISVEKYDNKLQF